MERVFEFAWLLAALLLVHCEPLRAATEFRITEVASGNYYHQGAHELMSLENLGNIGNSGFIVGSASVAVIDPGGSQEAGRLLKRAIETVTDLPVEYLLLTHFHPDHVAGAMVFSDTPNIIAHEKYSRAMTQRAQFYLDRFSELLPGNVEQVFRLPTQTVSAGQSLEIDLGGRTLSVAAYPLAHTDNDMTVHDQQTNTLWAGDLVFAQRTPSLDGSLTGWLDVLSMLDKRSYSVTVPGHGKPAPWAELVAPQLQYLRALRDSVRILIDQGISLGQVLEQHENELMLRAVDLAGNQSNRTITRTYQPFYALPTELELDPFL